MKKFFYMIGQEPAMIFYVLIIMFLIWDMIYITHTKVHIIEVGQVWGAPSDPYEPNYERDSVIDAKNGYVLYKNTAQDTTGHLAEKQFLQSRMRIK